MLGEVIALDPPLEALIERYGATPLFWRDWPQAAPLGPMPRMGLGLHFLKEAWRRWLVFDGKRDRLFHKRALSRYTSKGLRALEISEPPSKDESEALAQLFSALSREVRVTDVIPSRAGLIPPPPSPNGFTLWGIQAEAWQKAAGDVAANANWGLPGVMGTDLGNDPEFWRAYHRVVHSSPRWVRELAPLPLPLSAMPAYLEGWTGCTQTDFSQTLRDAAAWQTHSPLPSTWSHSAAEALRDRILTRFCFLLGYLCRGGAAKSLDLSAERTSIFTLFPEWSEATILESDRFTWPAERIFEWMAAVVKRMETH